MHIRAPGKERFKHLTRGLRVVIIEVHRPQVIVKAFNFGTIDLEVVDQNIGKIITFERRPHIHLWIDEAYVIELVDRISDFLGPILTAGLDHAVGKAVQGNVKNVPTRALKPCGEPTKLIMVFEQQHLVAVLREVVRAG